MEIEQIKTMKTKLFLIFLLSLVLVSCSKKQATEQASATNYKDVKTPEFNADSAYNYVKVQCDFGARTPESVAAKQCGDYLIAFFNNFADTVYVQEFTAKLYDGKEVKGRNIIASFNNEATDRVVLASHWDSRLWADKDEDAKNHRTPVIAANDGASGVGVLMELARVIKQQKFNQGLDIVLFDLEDQGAPDWADTIIEDQRDWCLGSQYWAQNLHKPYYSAKYGILLDMVGYKDLRFTKEQQSMTYAPSIMNNIWNIANDLGYSETFINNLESSVMDDHIWVNHYAKIPMIDIVAHSHQGGFFPYWHTTKDNMDCISKESLYKVGKVLLVAFFSAE